MKNSACILFLALLGACASGFEQFYKEAPGTAQLRASGALLPAPETPKVDWHSADMQADGKKLVQDGYVFIGESSFYGPANRTHLGQATAQGLKVGATLVLVKSAYMDTVTGAMPFTTVNPNQISTVTTSGTVNSFGSGGVSTGTFNANSTIVSPGGTTTTYIPYSVTRNSYYASYWARQDVSKMRLGIRGGLLSDDMRHKLERNAGVQVAIVYRGTPAFSANILEGDVITKLNDADVADVPSLNHLTEANSGKKVDLEIYRGDRKLTIPVTLGTGT